MRARPVAYEAGLWRELRGGWQGWTGRAVLRGERGNGAPMRERERKSTGMVRTLCLYGSGGRARLEARGYVPVPVGALEGPNGLRVKGLAVIEDEDSG
jgi:hypothetical protein